MRSGLNWPPRGSEPRTAAGNRSGRRIRVRGALVVILILVAACGDVDPDPTEPNGEPPTEAFVYPLDLGTSWTYLVASDDSSPSTRRVVGHEDVLGETYARLEVDGEPDSGIRIRQSGAVLSFIPSVGDTPADPAFAYVQDEFVRSFPWVLAYLDTVPGTRWPLIEIDTTLALGGLTREVSARAEGFFVGEESTETAAGTWKRALHFRMESEISVGVFGFDPSRTTIQEDYWLVDEVGRVRTETFQVVQNANQKPVTTEEEEVLESFRPGP